MSPNEHSQDADAVFTLLRSAPERYRTIRVAVHHWADRSVYRRSLARFRQNDRVAAILSDPLFDGEGVAEAIWRVWLSRPYRRRVESFEPPSHLKEISGGNESGYWQYFPDDRRAHVFAASPPREKGDADHPWPQFTIWLHPIVAELLAPASLWIVPEGAVQPLRIEVLGSSRHLDRDVIRARLQVLDWGSRDLWSENLWVADDYDILVDARIGILLRVACRLAGEEFSVREVYDVAFDTAMDSSLFAPRFPPGTVGFEP